MTMNATTMFIEDGLNDVVMGTVYLLTSLLVIITNSVVICVIILNKDLHFPSLWNIAFMAFCDFCYGLFYLVCAVPSVFLKRFAYSWNVALVASIIHIFLHGQNSINILLATIDRYLAVCWPLRYHHFMSARRFGIALAASITLNACRLVIIFVPNEEIVFSKSISITYPVYNSPFSAIAAAGIPCINVIIVMCFIFKIILEIRRSRRQVHAIGSPTRDHQLSITLAISAGLFCLLYVPSFVAIIWVAVSGPNNTVMQTATICMLSNSLWNVVLYAVTYKPFREACMRVFCKSLYRSQRQAELNDTFKRTAESTVSSF